MRRFIIAVCICLLASTSYARFGGLPFGDSQPRFGIGEFNEGGVSLTELEQRISDLEDVGGLTFYKGYDISQDSLDADSSLGSPTATFTASRGATTPATYFDSSGVMQVTTTDDIPRFTSGFYATDGVFTAAPGLLLEGARTNLLKNSIFGAGSGTADNWTYGDNVTNSPTLTLVEEVVTNISNSHAQRIQHTFGDGTFAFLESDRTAAGSVTQNELVTFSVFLKGTLTGIDSLQLRIKQYDVSDVAGTILVSSDIKSSVSSTVWKRFVFTATAADADANKVDVFIFINHSGSGSIDLNVAGAQVEQAPYPTSFIPTTTAALTRNGELLTYLISGNRTAATESMVFVFRPFWASGEQSFINITTTDTKNRLGQFNSGNDLSWFSNFTDDVTSRVNDLINESWVRHQQMSVGGSFKNSSTPYIAGYFDGVADGTDEVTDNFTTPAWGTDFNVGGPNIDIIIQSVAFFSTFLSADEQATVYNTLVP